MKKKTENEIRQLCDDHAHLLNLWDGAFSEVQTVDPTENNIIQAEAFIRSAHGFMRYMDLSIPRKAHGMEDHVMMQMTTIRGGIGELIEYWIVQYHQTGYKYGMRYRNMPNELEEKRPV